MIDKIKAVWIVEVNAGMTEDGFADWYAAQEPRKGAAFEIVRFAVGFTAGLADSFTSIETRDRILSAVACTRHRLDGFDLAADICSMGRRLRRMIG